MTKNKKIALAGKVTRARHKKMICKTFEIKIDKSHLSKSVLKHLTMLFTEARWYRNHIISQDDVFKFDTKSNTIQVKTKDKFEPRVIQYLSSQMKQGVLWRVKEDILALSALKKKGRKIGKLKFKRYVNMIHLQQYRNTYKIIGKNRIKIQGIKRPLRVKGLEQIPKNAEISCGQFIKSCGDYFIKVTCFVPEEKKKVPKKPIGLDAGIANQITFSNGIRVNYKIPITNKMKKTARIVSKRTKGSKNRAKMQLVLNKQHRHQKNIKKDIANKVGHYVKDNYDTVCSQNDHKKVWQIMWGKRIYETAIGGFTSTLSKRVQTPIEVDRFFASSKTCFRCKKKKDKLDLNCRVFQCAYCDWICDRDLNAALNIRHEGLKTVGTECIEPEPETASTPMETETATLDMLEYLNRIPHVKASLVNEVGSLLPLGGR